MLEATVDAQIEDLIGQLGDRSLPAYEVEAIEGKIKFLQGLREQE